MAGFSLSNNLYDHHMSALFTPLTIRETVFQNRVWSVVFKAIVIPKATVAAIIAPAAECKPVSFFISWWL